MWIVDGTSDNGVQNWHPIESQPRNDTEHVAQANLRASRRRTHSTMVDGYSRRCSVIVERVALAQLRHVARRTRRALHGARSEIAPSNTNAAQRASSLRDGPDDVPSPPRLDGARDGRGGHLWQL